MAEAVHNTTNEARLLNDERFLRRVAYAYYEEARSQEVIAEQEFCSRQMVSKALQRARERGIVRITITPDLRTGYLRNLSREVRVNLQLEDVVLTVGNNMTTDTEEVYDNVVNDITIAAAEYLDHLLLDSDILAVSGGQTFMRKLVRNLRPTRSLPHLQVVTTIGFVEARAHYGDANLIAFDIAEAYGANHQWFPCPAILSSEEQVRQVRQMPVIRETYEMMRRASVMVTGLWTPNTNEDMLMRGILEPEQIEAIEACHPAVDINHWVFDEQGRCINELLEPPPYFLSGLEIPRLKERIDNNNMKVILLAGGNPSYVPAIQAALRAGIVNILITDHVTAQMLS